MPDGLRTKVFATPAAVSVGTDATTILTLIPDGQMAGMILEVSSAAGSAASLNAFKIQRQDHALGAWYDYITTWTSPYPLGLSYASGSPATLAAAGVVHLHVDVSSAYGVRLVATVAASTATISALGLFGAAAPPGTLAEVAISGFSTEAQIGATTAPAAGTVNKQLADIKTDVDKIPSQGQALAAASTPVVLTAIQVTALTPPAAIAGFATEVTLAALLGSAVTYVPTPVAQGAPATTVIVAAEAGKTVCIHEVNLSLSAADVFIIKDSDGTVFGTWDVAATGRVALPFVPQRTAARYLAAGKGLSITTVAGLAKGFITYSKATS